MAKFVKGSLAARTAGRKGGQTGTKHFENVSKTKLTKLSREAGKKSGEARRAKKEAADRLQLNKQSDRKVDKIMANYLP